MNAPQAASSAASLHGAGGVEAAPQQRAHAVADHRANLFARQRPEPARGEQAVQTGAQVVEAVDERAVEVEEQAAGLPRTVLRKRAIAAFRGRSGAIKHAKIVARPPAAPRP
ncbi:MAG: hypothetical protein QM661_12750 [Solimonas sp.]